MLDENIGKNGPKFFGKAKIWEGSKLLFSNVHTDFSDFAITLSRNVNTCLKTDEKKT